MGYDFIIHKKILVRCIAGQLKDWVAKSLAGSNEIYNYLCQYLFSILMTKYSANSVLNYTPFFRVKFHAIAQEPYTSLKSQN